MKRLTLLIFVSAFFWATQASGHNQDSIVGQWYTAEGTSLVEIYKCLDFYCGRIVWLKNPRNEKGKDKIDEKNPDESLRNRKLLGLQILNGFTYEGENKWEGGKIYDPKSGKTYSCKMQLEDGTLRVRGFVGFSLLGRTTVWTKKDASNNRSNE